MCDDRNRCLTVSIVHSPFMSHPQEQQHTFNMPFQLGTGSEDHPLKSDKYRYQLQEVQRK